MLGVLGLPHLDVPGLPNTRLASWAARRLSPAPPCPSSLDKWHGWQQDNRECLVPPNPSSAFHQGTHQESHRGAGALVVEHSPSTRGPWVPSQHS